MTRFPFGLALGLVLFATLARAQTGPVAGEEPPSANFKIAEVADPPGAPSSVTTFAAQSGSGAAQARFLIEIDGESAKGHVDGGAEPASRFLFFKGRFRHVADSHPGPFLAEVATALGAKALRNPQATEDVVPFEIALLGAHLSRDRRGGFAGTPPGDWVASKLFLADGKAEVYFNFDTVSGDAEFSPKDAASGDLVVEKLSKVLW